MSDKTIFTACDPCGGGRADYLMALASGYFDADNLLVAIQTDVRKVACDADAKAFLRHHYYPINKQFPGARFVFIPENNLGLENRHLDAMATYLRDQKVETFWETDNRPGVQMTHHVKCAFDKLYATYPRPLVKCELMLLYWGPRVPH